MSTSQPSSDALVLFGVTGDLAFKMIFPALYAMTARGGLEMPVIGVASSPMSLEQLQGRVRESLAAAGTTVDDGVLHRLLGRLRYVRGDYREGATYEALRAVLAPHRGRW